MSIALTFDIVDLSTEASIRVLKNPQIDPKITQFLPYIASIKGLNKNFSALL